MNPSGEAKQYFILSLLASDRPGIVDEVSSFLFERECNIEDSRMAVLGGEFAAVLLASGAASSAEKVEADLGQLEAAGRLQVQFKRTGAPGERALKEALAYRIRATALDHPGIVFKLSRRLHEKGINIRSAETETLSAPFGGSPLFHLEMVVEVPPTLPVSQLRAFLTELADEENMDLELHSAAG